MRFRYSSPCTVLDTARKRPQRLLTQVGKGGASTLGEPGAYPRDRAAAQTAPAAVA
jgi:hypothetical protein